MISRDQARYERALSILHNFAVERTGWRRYVFGRWLLPDEPLRNDASNLVREVGYQKMIPYHTRLVGGPGSRSHNRQRKGKGNE